MFNHINNTIKYFKFIFFIQANLFSKKNRELKSKVMFNSIFLGLSLGLAILIVVIGVMNGFQENHISRRIEIGSFHITLQKKIGYIDEDTIKLLKNELYKYNQITAVTPYIDKQIIVKPYQRAYIESQVLKLRAFDPIEMQKDNTFMRIFQRHEDNFDLGPYSTFIGQELAYKLYTNINKYIQVTSDISLSSYKSDGTPFKVSNVFNTGSYDFDRYWIFISLESLSIISRLNIDKIGIKLNNYNEIKNIINELSLKYSSDYDIISAEDTNSGFFNALRIEKALMSFIFIIIFIMISINTIGAVRLSIMTKKTNIAILKALGTSQNDIIFVFILQSIFTGLSASIAGLILGTFLAYNIEFIFKTTEFLINSILNFMFFTFEPLLVGTNLIPSSIKIYDNSIYYQTGIPVKLIFKELYYMCFFVFGITVASGLAPVFYTSKLRPNEILRDK